MDRWDCFKVGRGKGLVGSRHMAGYRSGSSLHAELGAATVGRGDTITPIKAEVNRGKGVKEREIGNDTES